MTTVSIFQFVWEVRRTADARVLAGGAAGEGKEEDTARRRPEESLRLIIVGDGGGEEMGCKSVAVMLGTNERVMHPWSGRLFVQDAPGSGQFGNKSRDAATWPAVTNQLRITSV